MKKTIFLYGPPASGKSTLALKLADCLRLPCIDLDARIVQSAGCSIAEIFEAEGERGFRARETKALERAIDETRRAPAVVALGGGTLLADANRAACARAGVVLCLETPSPHEIAARLANQPGTRPLGDQSQTRARHYASFPNRLTTSFEAGGSLVVVGTNCASALASGWPCVADATVNALYPQLTGAEPIAVIPSGEVHKTPQTVMSLWRAMCAAGLGRDDAVLALGGGVTGDLTGFAAATWMRGIDWINVPTTLLAMVDASTGGKTGCDLPEGKNLAGAFHAPRLVVIDTAFLETLPPAILASGRAEMIKHEIIGGIPSASERPTAREIADNLMVKVGIVREDPFERLGRRILLNCGHTVAHAVEKATGYRVSHGEAVAIGCVEEARLAVRQGLAAADWPEDLARRFAAAGLPTALPNDVCASSIGALMLNDKKRAGTIVTFALPCGWGDVRAVKIDLAEKPWN